LIRNVFPKVSETKNADRKKKKYYFTIGRRKISISVDTFYPTLIVCIIFALNIDADLQSIFSKKAISVLRIGVGFDFLLYSLTRVSVVLTLRVQFGEYFQSVLADYLIGYYPILLIIWHFCHKI